MNNDMTWDGTESYLWTEIESMLNEFSEGFEGSFANRYAKNTFSHISKLEHKPNGNMFYVLGCDDKKMCFTIKRDLVKSPRRAASK